MNRASTIEDLPWEKRGRWMQQITPQTTIASNTCICNGSHLCTTIIAVNNINKCTLKPEGGRFLGLSCSWSVLFHFICYERGGYRPVDPLHPPIFSQYVDSLHRLYLCGFSPIVFIPIRGHSGLFHLISYGGEGLQKIWDPHPQCF